MDLSGRQLLSLKTELAETVEITKQQQESIQNLRWIEDRVPDAQRKFAEMEQKVAYESVAYRDSVQSQVKLEKEKNQIAVDLRDAKNETSSLRRKLDEAIKTADLHHRDHLAAQREVSDLRDVASKRDILNGKMVEMQNQIEELQNQLLESQNR